jgi:predicted N-acetyltransferase YhbS
MEEPGVVVREAVLADEAAVKRVISLAFAGVRRVYRPKPTARAIADDPTLHRERAVAVANGDVIGVIDFWVESEILYLGNVAVTPTWQLRGVLRALVSYVHAVAANRRCVQVGAVAVKETGSPAIYERVGFHAVDERVAHWCESDEFPVLHDVELRLVVRR